MLLNKYIFVNFRKCLTFATNRVQFFYTYISINSCHLMLHERGVGFEFYLGQMTSNEWDHFTDTDIKVIVLVVASQICTSMRLLRMYWDPGKLHPKSTVKGEAWKWNRKKEDFNHSIHFLILARLNSFNIHRLSSGAKLGNEKIQ